MILGRFLASVALGAALIGCGGGGGGGGKKSGVMYATDWSGATAVSQRISLFRADGTLVTQSVINRADTAIQQLRLSAPGGTYRLRAELNSGTGFGGTVVGVTEATVATGATLESSASGAVASVAIEPTVVSVSLGQTERLVAKSTTADGKAAFVAPGSLTWSVSGSNATVTADGTLEGKAFGDFTVTASHTSGKSTTASGQVTAAGATRSKWTVLVYMSAANNLYPYTVPNIDQMERVANSDVRFVVQWKESKTLYPAAHFDGTKRYLVKHNTAKGLGSEQVQDLGTSVDMGKPETLNDFIKWGKANYPADRYAVVVWSHGSGWMANARVVPVRATSYDDQFLSAIQAWQLPAAFAGENVDIISFDACLMQMMEVVSEIKSNADFIAASAENTPAAGYPYDRVFSLMSSSPSASTQAIAEAFVPGHVEWPTYKDLPVTQSVVETSRIGALETAVDGLAGALIANREALLTAVPEIRAAMPKYGDAGDGRPYYDLGDLCTRLKAHASSPTAVKNAAQAVLTQLDRTVTRYGFTATNSFSTGLSIDFSKSTNPALRNYSKLQFAADTRWDDWLGVAP